MKTHKLFVFEEILFEIEDKNQSVKFMARAESIDFIGVFDFGTANGTPFEITQSNK